ncbi:hypothetical protein A2U01_0096981, partial [Trifolium medium]|nr:hypothetical protein [Trifolium medium]
MAVSGPPKMGPWTVTSGVCQTVSMNTPSQQLVAWSRPPDGYVCLNVDG